MRQKEFKLIVTFHTTASAMAMEKYCKEHGIAGRLIPVPRSISAGCGLAWCAAPEQREELRLLLDRLNLEEEALHECMI